MTDDHHHSFEAARAPVPGGLDPLDRISLRDHIVTLDIGAFSEERGAKQRVAFTVEVAVLPPRKPLGDDVDKILSYDLILEAIEGELSEGRLNLLETLAEGVAARILEHAQAARVSVRIEKLDRVSGRLGVEISRAGRGDNRATAPHAPIRPHVYCLPEGAQHRDWFARWLKRVLAADAPALLMVEARAPERICAPAPLAHRRVDLLAAEQAAWALAAVAPSCIVTATRTEFEHAFKTGTATVWAPSKMVFDAAGGVMSVPETFGELADWFAREIDASALSYVARPVPGNPGFRGPVAGEAPV